MFEPLQQRSTSIAVALHKNKRLGCGTGGFRLEMGLFDDFNNQLLKADNNSLINPPPNNSARLQLLHAENGGKIICNIKRTTKQLSKIAAAARQNNFENAASISRTRRVRKMRDL